MDTNRNMLIAVILSVILIFVVLSLQSYLQPPKKDIKDSDKSSKKIVKPKEKLSKEVAKANKKPPKEAVKDIDKSSKEVTTSRGKSVKSLSYSSNKRVVPAEDYDILTRLGKSKIKSFEVDTDVFIVNFTTIDASIINLKLKEYPDETGAYTDAIFYRNKKKVYPLATSFVEAKELKEKFQGVYEYSHNLDAFKAGKSEKLIVKFYSEYYIDYKRTKKIRLEKTFSFKKDKYLFDIDVKVINLSKNDVELVSNSRKDAGFFIHWGESIGPVYKKGETSYDDVITTSYLYVNKNGDAKDEEVEDFVKSKASELRDLKWVSMDSRYLAMFMILGGRQDDKGIKRWNKSSFFGEIYNNENLKKENEEVIGLGVDKVSLSGIDKAKNYHFSILIGPKTMRFLGKDEYDEYEFTRVRRSWFPYIEPLEWGIEWLLFTANSFVNNFGWAIIILTVILKIILHPLTKKSMQSSRNMQKLQPKIKELNEKYKGSKNQQAKQKALMALYKREKINPLSGCLPLLLQMPVFFALYNVLPSILDLKATDFLWIHDLSSPDTVMRIDLGLTDKLNILPLIMTATFILQMKLVPQPTAPTASDAQAQTQKMMQYLMPGMFLFIFWNMPSGLVLYWTVQNILQTSQQLISNLILKIKSKK